MQHSKFTTKRADIIHRVRARLLAKSFPRVQMALIVMLTGGFGFLSSFSLLALGVDSMAMRYPLALGFAYLFFLLLIWLWLRTSITDYADIPDITTFLPNNRTSACVGEWTGTDASGMSINLNDSMPTLKDEVSSPLGLVKDSVSMVSDADEVVIPLLVVALLLGLAVASFYIIYIAPVIFAEVLVDGALSYALFRHLRNQAPQHWLSSTIRRTVLPFALTAAFASLMGAAMASYAPGAQSLGDVIAYANTPRTESQ